MARPVLPILTILLLTAGVCLAADDGTLDWAAWRNMPTFAEGRVMPLDTFARQTVEAICGHTHPTLALPDAAPRGFTAAELLFAWLAEPERWETTPFLIVADESLRVDVLGLPLFDSAGRRLRFASPAEVESNPELGRRWAEMQRRADAKGRQFHMTPEDKSIKRLVDAYSAFRLLTFNPDAPRDMHQRFYSRVRSAARAWRELAGDLQAAHRMTRDEEIRRLMVQSGSALQELIAEVHKDEFSREKVEKPVAAFHRAGTLLASRLSGSDDKPLAALATEFGRQATEMHLALCDDGETLRLVPSLSPAALEENRTPDDDAAPWLSFQAVMFGDDALLQAYPQAELQAVRRRWADVRAVYLDRGDPDRPAKFKAVMRQFVESVRSLGERIEPLRQRIPLQYRDQELIDATAYPPAGSTRAEVLYNRLNPFLWSWVVSLASVLGLLLAVGKVRRPMFWLGVVLLMVAQVFTVTGFALRTYITGLVPLTGMFESVVFVSLCVALLGLWFALLPLLWPGLQTAWQLTALPVRAGRGEPLRQRTIRWILFALRGMLMVGIFLGITRFPGRPANGLFDLVPPIALGASMPSVNEVLVWLAGLGVLAAAVYYMPRAAVSVLASLWTILRALVHDGLTVGMEQVMQRRLFALSGAIVSFSAVVLAYHAPATVMHRNIGAAAPILRDNFWLVVHVVTIIASYASAAIALILANITLGYYLFGRYRDACPATRNERRPPEACHLLASFTHMAIRITVLLLAAGTILGALWADVAWGRFWGWDPKEVWALISLLVYSIVLHARHIGWARDFGMTLASVLGATAVLFTWYGVNFILGSGLHSYGSGAGGQWEVAGAVVLNWLFLAAAGVRYLIETGGGTEEQVFTVSDG